jgi:predicted ribosome quality control (RQC) complex YloA/Tae2 family protein
MKEITKYIDAIKSDIVFKIGGNSQENFDIIDSSQPDDVWFHISDKPSEHVVASIPMDITIDKKQLHKIVIQGAVICKQFSKYNSDKNVGVVYTRIKDVLKTEKLGCVIPMNSKIVVI